jgi:PAS domain S-box-containing protein
MKRSAALVLALVVAGFVALLGSDLVASRQREIETTQRNSHTLSHLLERDIAAAVEKVDITLTEAVHDFAPVVDIAASQDVGAANRDLQRRMELIPETQKQSLRVVNSAGQVVFNAGPDGEVPNVNVSDRAFFQRQQADPAAGLVISEPLLSRFTNKWLVTLSRRMSHADGSFAGLVQAALRTEYFQVLLENLDVGANGIIALHDTEGRLLCRHPAVPDMLGKAVDMGQVKAAMVAGRNSGSFDVKSPIDGISRHYVFHKLENLPFVVLIGRSPDDFLYNWRRKAILYVFSLLALASALVPLFVILSRQAEKQRRLVAQVFEHSLEGIVILDGDSRILTANCAFTDITGYALPEVVGQPMEILGREDCADYRVLRAALQHRGSWRGEIWSRRKSGEDFPEWLSISALRDRGGRVTNYIGVFTDISELKTAEEKLRQTIERLDRTNTELERFTYIAAHDLREPLRTVTSFSQLLQQQYVGRFDADADEYIGRVVDAAKRMYALIGDLLEYSRVAAKGNPFIEVDINDACAVALQSLRDAVSESGAELDIAPLPILKADGTQLMQVFQNLIGNAIKFHRSGVPPRICVRAEHRDDSWEFSVADNGIGIEASKHDVFEIFRRLHRSPSYRGTGVGLAICKRIVERHGGRIWHEANPDGGTVFRFTVATVDLQQPAPLVDEDSRAEALDA